MSERFGWPWTKLAYTKEELEGIPQYLGNMEQTKLAISLGLWPYRRDVLKEIAASKPPEGELSEADMIALINILMS